MLEQEKFKWTLSDVFNVFVSVFTIEFFLYIIIKFCDLPYDAHVLYKFIIYILQVAGMILPLYYFAVYKKGAKLKDFGFKSIGLKKTVLWVLFSYVVYIGTGVLLIMTFYSLGIGSLGFEPQKSIFEIFGRDTLGIAIAFLIALVIAPLTEEIFFRGFVLQTLAKILGPAWGIALTALIFASVHFEFQSIMPLLILSVVLNVLFIKTRSVWPGIVFHILNNSIAFFIVLFGIVV
ncbi:CPBP family intramembrane metalloprotease [Candidatus Peregrinibacteria bacterium]|nr:CPBP family intramembrane metalloprotease [Candidatus Peregrinibacteria bacterium]